MQKLNYILKCPNLNLLGKGKPSQNPFYVSLCADKVMARLGIKGHAPIMPLMGRLVG